MGSAHLKLIGLVFLVSSCATANGVQPERGRSAGIGNATVIEDESLENARGGLLTILQSHVSGMTISRTGGCPHVVLRGGAGRSQMAEPLVYIDGQRIGDTCILDGLDVETIERAEVYASGVTRRPGYHSHSGGLILLFMKDGPEEADW